MGVIRVIDMLQLYINGSFMMLNRDISLVDVIQVTSGYVNAVFRLSSMIMYLGHGVWLCYALMFFSSSYKRNNG